METRVLAAGMEATIVLRPLMVETAPPVQLLHTPAVRMVLPVTTTRLVPVDTMAAIPEVQVITQVRYRVS